MLLQIGDRNEKIAEAQKLLSMLGYDLVIDGSFGKKTQRSVKAFQKRYGLMNDGVIGDETFEALKAAQRKSAKENKNPIPDQKYNFEINRNQKLSRSQYIKQVHDKNQLYLHFTAGSASAKGVIDYWDGNQPRIATAYVIDGYAGNIFECFNPKYWSYHLGVKGTKGRLDKASIGVEICNYGPLKKKGDKFYAWPENFSNTTVDPSKVYTLQREFRGFHYFEAFTDEQITATELLLDHLIRAYKINVQSSFDYSWFDFDPSVIKNKKDGIWSHSSVRKDKLDLYPDHRIIEMLNRLANKYGK
jgi:N-acetyl-anhydromuramyl-L-alanine amidase AmpD|tara:strand:+ start:25298 stop:26203 length:906 start_codon:yes stop_codon:yes gene_type:complete